MEDLSFYKNKLFQALGENSSKYLALLKMWFKLNLSKLEFDYEARKLLDKSAITYHNKFLVSLFSRCQTLSSKSSIQTEINNSGEPKKKKQKTKTKFKESKFLMDNCHLTSLPSFNKNYGFSDHSKASFKMLDSEKIIKFCTTEATLPDYFMSNLRLFVNVWEFGIDGLTDEAIYLTNLAIRDFIKNIITCILTFKSDFRTCENAKFQYAFGIGRLDPFIVNAKKFQKSNESNFTVINENGDLEPALPCTKEAAIQNALVQIACSTSSHKNRKINLWHLYYALRNNPFCIPINSIYTVNIERIQMKLID